MRKRNKYFKLVSLLVIFFILSLSLVGCAPKPDVTVKSFFDALQKQDLVTAKTYVNEADDKFKFDDAEQEKIVKSIFSKLKYEIISSSVEKDTATVKTKVIAPDLVKITTKAMSDILPILFAQALSGNTDSKASEKMFEQYFANSLADPNVAMTTAEVDIKLIKSKDKKSWVIQADDNLLNGITGNLIRAFEDLNKGINGQSSSENKPDTKIYKVGEEAKIGKASITVTKVEKSQGKDYDKPSEGNEFIIVTLKEKNIGNENISYNEFYFKLKNSKGQIKESSITSIGKRFDSGELAPGGEIEGTITFEAPKNDSNLIFMFSPESTPLLQFKLK